MAINTQHLLNAPAEVAQLVCLRRRVLAAQKEHARLGELMKAAYDVKLTAEQDYKAAMQEFAQAVEDVADMSVEDEGV